MATRQLSGVDHAMDSLCPLAALPALTGQLPGATTGFDPYLIWAEADNFAGYGLRKPPKWLPLLVELAPWRERCAVRGRRIAQMAARATRLHRACCACGVTLLHSAGCDHPFSNTFARAAALHALVSRFELGLPAGHHADDPTAPSSTIRPRATPLLQGKVMGLIDGGLGLCQRQLSGQRQGRAPVLLATRPAGQGRCPR
jgi:hypothetical protein